MSIKPTQLNTINAQRINDPFLRKNQVWFQKILPPAIERTKITQQKSNHIEQIALKIFNPKHIERSQLAPANYRLRLSQLQQKILRLSNQLPIANNIATLLQNEISLIESFNDNRRESVPC